MLEIDLRITIKQVNKNDSLPQDSNTLRIGNSRRVLESSQRLKLNLLSKTIINTLKPCNKIPKIVKKTKSTLPKWNVIRNDKFEKY